MSDTWEDNEYAKRARGRLRDAAELGSMEGGDFEHQKAQIELQIGSLMAQERSALAQEVQALTGFLALEPEAFAETEVGGYLYEKVEKVLLYKLRQMIQPDIELIDRIIHGGV